MKTTALVISLLLISLFSHAQSTDAKENTRIIESKNFIFIAQQAIPQSGASRTLTSQYDLTVRPDSVISELPFFGRAYTAPMNPTDGGIRFSSVKFGYESVKKKKGRYEISIRPSDAQGIISMNLSLYSSGRGTLTVTQLNRSVMTFYGFIREGRPFDRKAF